MPKIPKSDIPKTEQSVPPTRDTWHAPFIYVEEAPTFGCPGGTINVTLAAYRHMPDGDGKVASDLLVTAHLRCSIPGAIALREALDKALLIAAPTPSQPN